MGPTNPKRKGAYYTPPTVVASLVSWAVRSASDRLIDPSCGDGRFIASHKNSVGIDRDGMAARSAAEAAPWALVHESDFFAWAAATTERFDCAAGNPPFIRYQTFNGDQRRVALELCSSLGAEISGLASSWAPFLVATTRLLKSGGRIAFVVPAEIGHAPYAAPVLDYLVERFGRVQIVAVKRKLFPDLSEDCWLLFARDFGGRTSHIELTVQDKFEPSREPPRVTVRVPVAEWRGSWGRRLRPYLISPEARALYQLAASDKRSVRLGEIANVGIGYVSGANDFFHLRQSDAERWGIPEGLLHPTVRNGRALKLGQITPSTVETWRRANDPILLLRLPKESLLPSSVMSYLDSGPGWQAREAYKCRVREPWWAVPDIRVPDYFLSYMSGDSPSLVGNAAGCTCTNSVHAVQIRNRTSVDRLLANWETPFFQLSAEIEGHPLGGGMLKLEPREAGRLLVPAPVYGECSQPHVIGDALNVMRAWRHHGSA